MTKSSFLRNKFWPVIRASRNRMSLSLQHTANSLPPRFSFFLTTDNPPLFIVLPIIGTSLYTIDASQQPRIPLDFRVPEHVRVLDWKKLKSIDPTRQNVLPAHPWWYLYMFMGICEFVRVYGSLWRAMDMEAKYREVPRDIYKYP